MLYNGQSNAQRNSANRVSACRKLLAMLAKRPINLTTRHHWLNLRHRKPSTHPAVSSAYQLAREAVDQQKNTTEEIGGLRWELTITEQTLARTQALAKEALTNAQSAYTEALSLLGDAYSLVVPNVEWQFMKRQAAQYSEESRQIKKDADLLTAENTNMLDDVSDQIIGAGDVLAKGVAQQQIADELLADADVALGRSQEAVSLGDKTLAEAQKTLETLEGIFKFKRQSPWFLFELKYVCVLGFDSLVQESKEKARDALGQAGEITNLIEQAEERTREAQNALAGAESDARVARDSAKQAQEHAEQASKVYWYILSVLTVYITVELLLGRCNDSPRSFRDER